MSSFKITFFFSFVLVATSALLRLLAFHQTPFATGWDSYFYLVQIKSLEESGHMHSPEASLIYPYLRLFYWITGDYVLAMKAGAAVLCGIFTLLLCCRSQSLPLLGAWSLFSPQLTYFAAQYPKNLLGLVFFMAFVRSLDWAVSKQRAWAMLPIFLLVINYFGHRMMFGLSVLYLLLWVGLRLKLRFNRRAWCFSRRAWCFHQAHLKQDTQRKPPFSRLHLLKTPSVAKTLLAIGVLLGVFILLGEFFPGLTHIADLGRLNGTLSWQPQFSPWSFVQSFGMERISSWWVFEIAIVTGCWLAGLFFSRKSISNPALFWLCGLLLFPFLEWSLTGLAWRMFLVFVLLTPLAFDFQNVPKKASIVFFTAFVAASFFSWKSYSPGLHDPDYALFNRVTDNVKRQLSDPDSFGIKLSESSVNKPELFIAHNALAEYFTFTTGTDAMPWLPEYTVDSSKLWRIAAGVHAQTLRYFARPENAVKIKHLGAGYFILPEFVWQLALRNARTEGDEYFLETAESWLNPHRIRPAFLLKRKQ
ncbi:MAG: hypothetical protein ACKVU0_19955 [Saprospiraceae bacterium]